MLGDRRHFPAALLVPDLAALGKALGVQPDVARAQLDAPETRAHFQRVVDDVNQALAQFERIKKFACVADEWTVENGVLTPTLKVKRRVIEEHLKDRIDALYAEPPPADH
jgi:long-chain acyl-CoA synthetase